MTFREGADITRSVALRWALWALLAVVGIVALIFVLRPGDRDTDTVSYDDPTVWMVSRASGEVVRVNGAAGDVATRLSVGEKNSRLELVPVGADIAVLDRDQGEVSLIDSIGLQKAGTVSVDDVAEAQLVSNGEHAYLVTRTAVQPITTGPLAVAPAIVLDAPVTSPVVGHDGTLWAIERRGGAVVSYRDGEPDDVVEAGVDASSTRLAATAGGALMVDLATPKLGAVGRSGLEPSGCAAELPEGDPVVGNSPPTTREPYVTVTNADAGTVVVWDVAGRRCRTIDVADTGSDLGQAVVLGDTGFVPDYSAGAVVIVDLNDGANVGRVGLGRSGRQFELFEHHGAVWFNDPFGSDAALLDRGGIVRVIEKLGAGAGGVAVGVEPGDGGLVSGGSGPDAGLGVDVADGDNGTSGRGGSGTGGGDGTGIGDDGLGTGADSGGDQSSPVASIPPDQDQGDPDPDANLTANFTFSTSTVKVGEQVEFVDASDGGPTSWSWTFGDGTAKEGPTVTNAWDEEGIYTVTLTVDRDDGASDSTSVDITVLGEDAAVPPVADFAFTSQLIEVGESVTFTDRSTGSPTSWSWTFGDGSEGSGPTVTHTYDSPGTFQVGLTVTNDVDSDFVEATITVLASVVRPEASIVASSNNPNVGQFVTFRSDSSGSPTSLAWDFGDGQVGSGTTVSHAFAAAGTFTVQLTATNSAGSDTATATVVVDDDASVPVARFTVSDDTVQEGQPVVFTSTSLNEPETLSWDFGDGSGASGESVVHSFDQAGSFDVVLTATNSEGSSTFQRTIDVEPGGEAPIASFSVSSESVFAGDEVLFTDTSANGPTEWAWDFGDGSTAAGQDTSHFYRDAGEYTVTLTVSNEQGSDSTSTVVNVAPPAPSAAFTSSPVEPRIGEVIGFTDQSTGSPSTWVWNFGDGTSSSQQNPQHTYSQAGSYTVELTVSNATASDTTARTVTVIALTPVANFTMSPSSGVTTADAIRFTDLSANQPTSWTWDFGDGGAMSTEQSPIHTYDTPGRYTVTLTASNSGGSDEFNATVVVTQAVVAPVASFSVAPGTTVPAGTTVTFDDTSSNEPTSWTWSMPDGSSPTGRTATFTFGTAGTFTVGLTVSNSAGSDSITRAITVLPPPPVADFTFTVSPNGLTVSFADASTGGPTSWQWAFGDGTTSGERNPVHSYAPGTYTVTLVAANAGGSSAPASRSITITAVPPPTASFSFSTSDLTAAFTDTSSGPITNWLWDFGDGTTSTAQNPVHVYGAANTYVVRLTVSGPGGADAVQAAVTVTAPPPPPPPPPPPTTTTEPDE